MLPPVKNLKICIYLLISLINYIAIIFRPRQLANESYLFIYCKEHLPMLISHVENIRFLLDSSNVINRGATLTADEDSFCIFLCLWLII